MKSKSILLIGFIVSFLYIGVLVYFQTDKEVEKKFKYLYLKSGNDITIVAKLKKDNLSYELLKKSKESCLKNRCQEDILFGDFSYQKKAIKLLKELLDFIYKNRLDKASIIAISKDFDINFLVMDEKLLLKLKKVYKPYEKEFNIKDRSSVLKVFDVESIQKEINSLLKDGSFSLKSKNIKFLNLIFRKLKVLGRVKLEIFYSLDIDEDKFKSFILKNYDWIKDIKLKKSNENKIVIKEVL